MTKNKTSNKLSLLFQKANRFLHSLRDLYLIWSSPLFDWDFYAKNNPDVKRTGLSLALHFLRYGGFEGRDPGPNFSILWYLSAYADAKKSGINPLLHYVRYGRKQGYTPLSIEENLDLIRASGMFNELWYLAINTDVAQSGMDAAAHYLLYGGYEGRDPCPSFHSSWYLDAYKDVRKAGINPLIHYMRFGWTQERDRGCEEGREVKVFKLERMYDYSKQAGCVTFEDSPERIYLQRPRVIGAFSGELNQGDALCPSPYVSMIENVMIFGGSSLVIADQEKLLSDELVDFTGEEIGIKSPLVKLRQEGTFLLEYKKESNLQIKEGVLLSCDHDNNYFHWLVECLPKLVFLDEIDQFKEAPLLIPKGLHKNLEEALRRVNVNDRQLIYIEPDVAYRVERLIYLSPLSRVLDRYQGQPVFDADIVLSHKWINKVDDLLKGNLNDRKKPWRKLFLTRKKGLRALENREALELALIKQGFEIVELDGISLDFQIELFSQASMIVAPTGATLTNMLFCQPGTKVIILMSNHEVTNFYFWSNLGEINNLDITTIAGERLFNLTNYWSVHDDYVIDIDLVLKETEEKRAQMNCGRNLYFKTLIASIIEKSSQCDHQSMAEVQQTSSGLSSIEDAIRAEIYNIQSKQEEGYWQATKGDQLFIKYMNKALIGIKAALSDSLMSKEQFHRLNDHLQQLLDGAEIQHHPKIKATFLVQETFTWTSFESVYEAFTADTACEAQLVYLDFEHDYNDKSRNWFAEYKNMGLPIIHSDDYDLSAESPDLIFFVKPYDSIPKQFYIDNIDKVVKRSIYIPYFVNWMALENIDYLIDYHFRLPLHKKAWKIFDTPNYVREFHAHYGSQNGKNVEVVGHPRFDGIRKLSKFKRNMPLAWENKTAGKKVFMWNTHAPMSLASDKNEDWSTFELFGQNMLSYFSQHKEAALLWRPHPMFFSSVINSGIMTASEIEELKDRIEKSENIILDTMADYRYAFSSADALISDASSLLVEFLGTFKPIIYSCRENTYFLVNHNLLPAYYKATQWTEMEGFIEMIKEGKDDLWEERIKVIKDTLVNLGQDIGEIVKESCIEELKKEEVLAATKLVEDGFVINLRQDSA